MTESNEAQRAVARALRAAADTLDPAPAGPRLSPAGRTGAAVLDGFITGGFVGMDELSLLRREVTALRDDGERWRSIAVAQRERLKAAESAEESTPESTGGAKAVLAVVEAARLWCNAVRSRETFDPFAERLIAAVDALKAPLDGGRAPITLASLLDVADRAAYRKGWTAGVRWAAAEIEAQLSTWPDTAGRLDVTDHLRACADNPGRKTAVARDQAPAARQVEDTRPQDALGNRASCSHRPQAEGGVWGSYVEYLAHLEHVVMAAREWRSFKRASAASYNFEATRDLIRAVDSLDHPEGT